MPGVFNAFRGTEAEYYTYYASTRTLNVTCWNSEGRSTTKSLTIVAY